MQINRGVVKGRKPLKLYSGPCGLSVKTDEIPEVFTLFGFCRPQTKAQYGERQNPQSSKKVAFSHFFDILSSLYRLVTPSVTFSPFTSQSFV